MMDVFPPQSDSICAGLFVKVRTGQTAEETRKVREEEKEGRERRNHGGRQYRWVDRFVRGTAEGMVSCRVHSEDGVVTAFYMTNWS